MTEIALPFSVFGEGISACNRSWRSSCKTRASYEEAARSTPISGSFAGGKRHPTEQESIDGGKSEQSTGFQIWKPRVKRQAFLCRTSMHERRDQNWLR